MACGLRDFRTQECVDRETYGDLWDSGTCGIRDDVDSGTCQWTQGCVDREAYGDLWTRGVWMWSLGGTDMWT